MFLRLSIFTFFLFVINTFAQSPPIESGISQTLAKWRAANYSDVRYKLNLTLEKMSPLMKGDIEIRVNLTDEGAKNDLILDWRTTAFANDKNKPFAKVIEVNDYIDVIQINDPIDVISTISNEHLIVPKAALNTGENVIKIQFASPVKTSGAAITRYVDKEDGAEYVYSLFVPSDASTAFPVFDQPDLKARFELSVDAPSEWKVISNTMTKGLRIFGQTHTPDWKPHTTTLFKATEPISTYVFAFAAGDFTEFDECKYEGHSNLLCVPLLSGKELQTKRQSLIYVRKSQAEKFKQHAAETFRLNREAVKYLEGYFDYKFPFPKYDLVLLPEFPFGGMEHAGATFLREDRVIFPTEPTKNDFVTRANLIFHEAAHQWFGDTVTMRWFDDLWLKEGFAEFMAYKTLEKVMPEYNAWKIFYERNKQSAYLTDSTKGTTPIYQEIPNLASAKSAYGNIVYRKAPSFLKQAEFYLGADKFQTAVRQFLKKHQFANAEWTDLVKEFDKAYNRQNLNLWADTWVKQKGLSKITLQQSPIKNTIGDFNVSAKIENNLDETNERILKFKVLVINQDGSREFRIFDLFEKSIRYNSFVSVKENPQLIFPNYQDYGYGIFLLDEKSRDYVQKNIQNEPDDFLRTMMWGSLWDSVRGAELPPQNYVALVIKNINVETDESTIQTLLGRVSTAMNNYLSDAQSKELAPNIEAVLIDKMQNAPTLGQRITFYRAFLNIASSEKARTLLKDTLSGKYQIKDLKLKTKDRFDIITKLLILDDKDAPKLLAELEKTETGDEAKRYAYAAKAGINSGANKQKFFADFINDKNVSESWIEAALSSFNSVRQADLTAPFLEKSLQELPNLKRNRKIFFVNGWLAAFIGGQKDERALQTVNRFLSDNPNLDKDLRLKILEVADGLERGIKIRQKFAGK